MVNEQMALIQDVQTDEWWEHLTIPMLEEMRRRLRELIKLTDSKPS
jgi:type I restriction enzyme R subunit